MNIGKWMIAALLLAPTAILAAQYHLPRRRAVCHVNKSLFSVHVAANDAERAQGFAQAEPSLIEHSAILFVYPQSRPIDHFTFGGGANQDQWKTVDGYFNMRHMKAPLDIAFMDSHGRIITVLRMVPGDELYRPKKPYAAALELAAGRAAQMHLAPGVALECQAAGQ